MGIEIDSRQPQRVHAVTHESTGVIVHFRKLDYLELCRISTQAGADPGSLIPMLAQKGVGVEKWEGVEQKVNGQVTQVPYSHDALNKVCDAYPEFGDWFIDQLFTHTGMSRSGVPADELEDAKAQEKKDAKPKGGQRAGSQRTRQQRGRSSGSTTSGSSQK